MPDPPQPRSRALAVSAFLAWACAGVPEAVAGTNQIAGRVGFSNTNPAILAVLGAPQNAGLATVDVNATAQAPAPFSTHDAAITASDPVSSPWTIDVDASAAGTTYRVAATAHLGPSTLHDEYYFRTVTSPPVLDEPAPDTALDILECAGIVRVRYVDAGGAPVTVQGDRVTADSSAGGVSPLAFVTSGVTQKDVVVRGDGSTYTVRAEITYGTDPFNDRMTQLRTATVVVNCDEIVDLPVVVTTAGAPELATIRGRLDIVGEDEIVSAGTVANTRSRVEGSGPWRNLRADAIPGPPSEGAWTLQNLVDSTVVNPPLPWVLKAETAFGSGYSTSSFTTPTVSVAVNPGESVDAGDAFVLQPVEISGAVTLVGPPADPVVGSLLQRVWRAADRDVNGDTVPDDLARMFDSTIVTARGRGEIATGATRSALGAVCYASLAGAYDPATASFPGTYRAVLGNLGSEPGVYEADELNLKLQYTAVPAEPRGYVDERVDIDEPGTPWDLPAGAQVQRDRAYCFSKVTLGYACATGNFFDPSLTGTGSFTGTDFRGQAVSYDATAWWARGTPSLLSRAAATGRSVFLLPAGAWTLEPSYRLVTAPGVSVLTTLPPMTLQVGCRQSIEAVPEVQVAVSTDVEPCPAAATVTVSGTAHADAGVASLAWSVGGGSPTTLCTSCGVDAPFSFDAPLVPGDNVVRVEAVDAAGAVAATEVFARRASEPSAVPVRVAKDPGGLLVSWAPEPRDVFAVHAGTIASLHAGTYDHDQLGGCGRTGSSAVIAAPAGGAYILVTSGCGAGHGSYGRDSFGTERPPSPSGCR